MGSMLSDLKEIDNLWFKPFPTRPLASVQVVRVGNHIFGLGVQKHVIYTNSRVSGMFAFTESDWPWLTDVLKALVMLKVVSKSVADQHKARREIASHRRHARFNLEHIERDLKSYGVELTAEQKAAIQKVAKHG
jgi:hypothetical protein